MTRTRENFSTIFCHFFWKKNELNSFKINDEDKKIIIESYVSNVTQLINSYVGYIERELSILYLSSLMMEKNDISNIIITQTYGVDIPRKSEIFNDNIYFSKIIEKINMNFKLKEKIIESGIMKKDADLDYVKDLRNKIIHNFFFYLEADSETENMISFVEKSRILKFEEEIRKFGFLKNDDNNEKFENQYEKFKFDKYKVFTSVINEIKSNNSTKVELDVLINILSNLLNMEGKINFENN